MIKKALYKYRVYVRYIQLEKESPENLKLEKHKWMAIQKYCIKKEGFEFLHCFVSSLKLWSVLYHHMHHIEQIEIILHRSVLTCDHSQIFLSSMLISQPPI